MPIEFQCQQCGKILRVGDETAGKQARCPECGMVQPIPAAGSAPATPPPIPDFNQPGGGPSPEVNPYTSPTAATPFPQVGATPVSAMMAKSQVQGPAIGLIVTGALGILAALIGMVSNAIQMAGPQPGFGGGGDEQIAVLIGGGVGLVLNVVGIFISIFIIFGALKMKSLRSYTVSMAASIVAMIPCLSPCCLVGLPIGIWSIVVLSNQGVKSAFTN